MADQVVKNSVKLVGERFLPGTSLMMDGDIKGGLAHVALGVVAGVAFGPVAWFAVAADSYSRSVTGKGLVEHLGASPSPAAASAASEPPKLADAPPSKPRRKRASKAGHSKPPGRGEPS